MCEKVIILMIKREVISNKMRSFMILMCIAFSIALLYASTAVIDVIMDSYKDRGKVIVGSSDIIIEAKATSAGDFFRKIELPTFMEEQISYAVSMINIPVIDMDDSNYSQLLLRGISIDDLSKMELTENIKFQEDKQLSENTIIINSEYAKQQGLSIGDVMHLEMKNVTSKLRIVGIFDGKEELSKKAYANQAFVSKDFFKNKFDIGENYINSLYIKLKNNVEIETMIQSLYSYYASQDVRQAFLEDDFYDKMQGIIVLFIIISAVIGIMCYLIIYNAFKVIMHQRMRDFGILRSIGAEKSRVSKFIGIEGMLYGFSGGVIGVVIGILLTFGIGYILKPSDVSQIKVKVDAIRVLVTILVSVAIVSIVALGSVKDIRKRPIKDLIQNVIKYKHRKVKKWRIILLTIIFVTNIVFVFVIPSNTPKLFIVISIVVTIATLVYILPSFLLFIFRQMRYMYFKMFKNIGYIAIQNIKGDRLVYRNIILLAISIGTIIMVNSAINSIIVENYKTYVGNYSCDYILTDHDNQEEILRILGKDERIKGYYELFSIQGVEVTNKENYKIYTVDGIDKEEYLEYRKFDIKPELLQNLSKRVILLSTTLKSRLDADIGETLLLKLGNKDIEYIVGGFFETSINNGNYAMIPKQFLQQDADMDSFVEMYIKMGTEDLSIIENIRIALTKYNPKIQTVKEMIDEMFENEDATFMTIRIISWLPIIVGIIIVIGNSVLSFYERKKNIAILRTLGMNILEVKRMLLLEHITVGVLASAIGVIIGNMLVVQIVQFLRRTSSTMPIKHSMELSVIVFLTSTFLYMIPALAISSKKLNFSISHEVRNVE